MNILIPVMTTRRPAWLRLLLAAGLAVLAQAAWMVLQVDTGEFPFLTFYPAVLLASLLPGNLPGLLCLLVSVILSWHFTVLPPGEDSGSWKELAALGVFALMGLMFVINSMAIKSGIAALAQRQAESAAQAHLYKFLMSTFRHCLGRFLSLASETLQRQRQLTPDDSASPLLDDSIERLDALYRLCRRLYATDEGSDGPVGLFLEDVCRDLLSTRKRAGLRCAIKAESIRLPSERRTALGLIAIELVTGALEAPAARSGSLEIEVKLTPERLCQFSFRDGRPDAGAPRSPKETGNKLSVTELVTKLLGGSICQRLEDGRSVILQFPI